MMSILELGTKRNGVYANYGFSQLHNQYLLLNSIYSCFVFYKSMSSNDEPSESGEKKKRASLVNIVLV